jgi:hypothetical protein
LPSTGTSCNRSILSLLLKGSCQGVVCRRNLCDSNAVKLMQLLLYDTRAVPYNREAPLTSGNKPKRERRRGGAKRNAQQAAAAAEQPAPQVVISSSPSVMVARARARVVSAHFLSRTNIARSYVPRCALFIRASDCWSHPVASAGCCAVPGLLLSASAQLPSAALHDAPAVSWRSSRGSLRRGNAYDGSARTDYCYPYPWTARPPSSSPDACHGRSCTPQLVPSTTQLLPLTSPAEKRGSTLVYVYEPH